MNVGIMAILAVFMSAMIFMVQRSEAKRRLFVIVVMLGVGELIRRYVFYRGVHTEAWTALFIAVLVNFLYWLFIGRYNPPASSDEIKVIGLDD